MHLRASQAVSHLLNHSVLLPDMLSFGVWVRPSPRNTLGTVLGCSDDDEVSGSGRCGGATVVLCVGVVRACTCALCRTDRLDWQPATAWE